MRMIPRLLTIALLAAPLPAAAQAPTPVGQISGTVYEKTGQPLAYANISVQGTGVGALSDDRGRFKIANVPTGMQTLRIHWSPEIPDGYHAVEVEAGRTRKVKINLRRREWLNSAPPGQIFAMRLEGDCFDASYLVRDGELADLRRVSNTNASGEFGQQIDSARPWKVTAHYALQAEGVPLAIDVLDSTGTIVKNLRSGPAGQTGMVEWKGETDGHHEVAPGTYALRFATPSDTTSLGLCLRRIPLEVGLNDWAGAHLKR